MNLNLSHILMNVIRVFKFIFIVSVIGLILLNAVLVNVYSNIFLNLRGDHEERIKVSSSIKSPAVRTSYNSANFTFNAEDHNTLLNITDFQFVLNHADKCNTNELFMIIFVHSAVGNFAKREAIRKTWASTANLRNNLNQIRVIFLIGQSSDANHWRQIESEDNQYGDMVQGNFIDTYRNMTYKHVMGLKWVTYYCRNARFVFKADDDVWIHLEQLIFYMKGNFGVSPRNLMACFLNKKSWANRSYRNKWRVSYKEYSQKYYPRYCSGWGIIMSPDVVMELYRIARSRPYFWIDDVFISGILAQDLKINHTDLGARLAIDQEHVGKWLESSKLSLPPIFGFPDSSTSQIYLLWNKTTQYYKTKFNHTFD